jgi:hypothetical protein
MRLRDGRDAEAEAVGIAILALGLRALADVDLSMVDISSCLNSCRALLQSVDQKAEMVVLGGHRRWGGEPRSRRDCRRGVSAVGRLGLSGVEVH